MGSRLKWIIITLVLSILSLSAHAQTKTVVVIPLLGDDAAAKWRGAWADDVDYMKGDIVEEGGSSFIAKERHTSTVSDLPLDATFWDLVAASGTTGPRGPKGVKGNTGDPGTAATITVGTTTTGNAGTDASVANSGSESAAIFNFTIPKGDKGDTGEKGLLDQATLDKIMHQLRVSSNIVSRHAKIVFVTSSNYNGDLVTAANNLAGFNIGFGGLQAGDYLCDSHAKAVGLQGTYLAWLSDASSSPSARFTQAAVPYVLTSGDTVAYDWNDLTDGSILATIILTENGDSKYYGNVYTGTNNDGTAHASHCDSWTTADGYPQFGNIGGNRTEYIWSNNPTTVASCNNEYPIYCFQQ